MTLNKLVNIILVLSKFKSLGKFPIAMVSTTSFLFLIKIVRAKRAKQTPLV
jgi:hypothetical protein